MTKELVTSINEPDTPALPTMVRPTSINEPPTLPDAPDAPPPTITSLTPDRCAIGDPDFTLYISGTGFVNGISTIHFAGHDEPTTFNADGTLSTGVKPSLWAEPVDVVVEIHNGEKVSAPATFSFEATPPAARSTGRHGHGRR